MFVQNIHRIVGMPRVMQGQLEYCATNCIRINLVFQKKTSHNNIQIYNDCAIEITDDRD